MYFDIWDDEIQYDDYDIGVNSMAGEFKVVSALTNTVMSGNTSLKFPGNIYPEGYFYNPKTVIKLADISDNISSVSMKQIKYKLLDEGSLPIINEGYDEDGNAIAYYHAHFSIMTKYDFIKGDFIALYQSSNDKVIYGVVNEVNDGVIDVAFEIRPDFVFAGLSNESTAMLTSREYIAPYATFLPASRAFVWRDLIKPSELPIDSALYDRPFSNGCLYIHQNVNFFLKRQDPRNEFGLLYPEDSNNNAKPQIKNYKKPGNSEIDTSAYEVFSDNLKNICY